MTSTIDERGYVRSTCRNTRFLGLAVFFAACAQGEEERVSARPADDWPLGDAVAAGFDQVALDQLAGEIDSGAFPNTHALLIESDGVLVYERYFRGTDQRWGGDLGSRLIGPDSLHDLRSISKSVTSALLGIALATDFESATSRSLSEYLPGIEIGESQRAITLHHALTMTAGLEWNEMTVPYTDRTNDEIALYRAADPAREVMTRPLAFDPGSTWYYSGGLTQVLGTVLHGITGELVDDYARDQFFEPLGITDYEWLGPGDWTPDNPALMSGLRLRARDLAKVGSVFLHEGRWKGRQIVPEAWVALSMTRHVPEIGDWSRDGMWGYGYQWWVGDLPEHGKVVAGFGNGNQRVFILPDPMLVVTILAGEYNRGGGGSDRILTRVLAAQRDQVPGA